MGRPLRPFYNIEGNEQRCELSGTLINTDNVKLYSSNLIEKRADVLDETWHRLKPQANRTESYRPATRRSIQGSSVSQALQNSCGEVKGVYREVTYQTKITGKAWSYMKRQVSKKYSGVSTKSKLKQGLSKRKVERLRDAKTLRPRVVAEFLRQVNKSIK